MNENVVEDETAPKPTQDEVAKKAYAIYETEGRPQGHAEQNWSDAQAQLQHGGAARPEQPKHQAEHEDAHQGHQNHHAHMAADFRKRFWISLVLTLPILALSPLLQTLVGLRDAIGFTGDIYVLFAFSSAVFWYGGWPFLKGLTTARHPVAIMSTQGRSRLSFRQILCLRVRLPRTDSMVLGAPSHRRSRAGYRRLP
ncbi:MAG: DUF2934 domain-containing protein [Polaromonas sp.]|nr:DUF2934 domain-containing protein [Polaromonas sp.]